MLRKCIDNLGGDSDAPNDINVQVSCACCGGIVKESTIEDNDNPKRDEGDDKAKEIQQQYRGRDEIDGNILLSKPPRRFKFRRCIGRWCKCISRQDKSMADKAAYIYTAPSGSQKLSES